MSPPSQDEAALLGAAADNLTPAVMADEEECPLPAPVRELEEIDPGMLPQVDELRAQAMREQRASNRRRNWIIAVVLVVVAGGVVAAAARAREQAEGRRRLAQPARRAHRGRSRRR